jgi:N-acetylmuramoyl-L-alanine amidase
MKKWISLLSVAVLILFANVGGASAAASKPAAPVPKLYLDGKLLPANVPPTLYHSSMLVPIRTVAENLGYKVSYDVKKKLVTLNHEATLIKMTVNNKKATVNGKTVVMNEVPIIKSNTTLIPIKFVGQLLDLQIVWDSPTKSAFLYTPGSNADSGSGSANGGTGADTGTDSGSVTPPGAGTGSNGGTGSVPADGGLIGSVDGTDGTGVDGGTPVNAQAFLHQVRYETDAVILGYEGTTAPTTNVLTGPDRIVVDLPNTEFAADFTADNTPVFANGLPGVGQIAEFPVTGNEALQKIRFAQYSDNPKTVRVVLDLNQRWDYQVSNNGSTGEIRIQLNKPQPKDNRVTIVLDAGHGGTDPGASSVVGRWEKEFNLIIVKKVKALIGNDPNINLVLTRESDVYPSLDDRVNLANSIHADLFLSVHANSYYKATNGTETYYTRANSEDFARLLHKNAVAATGFKDNGVRVAGFKVIKYTTMPAALLEVGYLSNDSDGPQLFTEALQNRVAAAIAASFKQYFNLP